MNNLPIENITVAKNISFALILAILAVSLSGCKTINNKPDAEFHVIAKTRLHDDMLDMALELATLLELYLDESVPEPRRNITALDALNNIENIASGLGGGKKITNYSVINDYMGAFLYDVSVAKYFVQKKPANYFPSGALIKSCLACHESI